MHIKGRFLKNKVLLGFRVMILVIGSMKNYVSYQLLAFYCTASFTNSESLHG